MEKASPEALSICFHNKTTKKKVTAFCAALKERLPDRGSSFGKEYLKLLVDEIRVNKKEVHLSGSYTALAGALCMSTKPALQECPVLSLYGSPARTRTTDKVVNSNRISIFQHNSPPLTSHQRLHQMLDNPILKPYHSIHNDSLLILTTQQTEVAQWVAWLIWWEFPPTWLLEKGVEP